MQQTSKSRSEAGSPTLHGAVVKHRYYLAGAVAVLLLTSVALLVVAIGGHLSFIGSGQGEVSGQVDVAGLAMGGQSNLSALDRVRVLSTSGSYSGDDEYDPATGARPEVRALIPVLGISFGGSYSGDDEYDPAMGAHPEQALLSWVRAMSNRGSYSGDDEYDPAAGGRPELSRYALLRAMKGWDTYSGDDEYDPAAGGILGR